MQREDRKMLQFLNTALKAIDDLVWGVPLIVLILATGIYLTVRLKGMQIRKLPAALRYMVQNEEEGSGEVTSFGALCTAMSATIGTGNIVGVATAIVAGGPGALFWMWIAALFGMATIHAEHHQTFHLAFGVYCPGIDCLTLNMNVLNQLFIYKARPQTDKIHGLTGIKIPVGGRNNISCSKLRFQRLYVL